MSTRHTVRAQCTRSRRQAARSKPQRAVTTRPPAAHPPAFTLIEVLIALAIFAMASTYLTTTFVSALTARERSFNNDVLHADIRAVRMQLLLEPNRDDAEDGGSFPTLHHGDANWRASIEPTEVVDLFSAVLTIEFSQAPEDSPGLYEETLFLLRPTWSEADERSELLQDKRDALERSRDFSRF